MTRALRRKRGTRHTSHVTRHTSHVTRHDMQGSSDGWGATPAHPVQETESGTEKDDGHDDGHEFSEGGDENCCDG
jgi:hypothetical protein